MHLCFLTVLFETNCHFNLGKSAQLLLLLPLEYLELQMSQILLSWTLLLWDAVKQ